MGCDEIFIDPWIESYVSKVTEDLGLWSQALLTSLAESGRETLFSGISMGFQAGYSSMTNTQIMNSMSQNDLSANTASELESSTISELRY